VEAEGVTGREKKLMESQPGNTQAPRRKRWSFRRFIFVSLFVVAVLLLIFYLICGMAYSEGTRSGILTKVSKKGFVFKTYEGEINVGGISDGQGTIMPATVFRFSVNDRKVYEKLEMLQGQRVAVRYRQVIKNFFWQGDTDYFIEDVTPLK
jgi:hypothetical protein